MYKYKCIILRVIDGDTVDVDIDLGFDVWLRNERVRIAEIDAPESRTSDAVEKIFGMLAKEYVHERLPEGSSQILYTKSYDNRGKYGRILGDFVFEGTTLTEEMLQKRLVVPYHGESKADIQTLHEANRQYLIEKGIVIL